MFYEMELVETTMAAAIERKLPAFREFNPLGLTTTLTNEEIRAIGSSPIALHSTKANTMYSKRLHQEESQVQPSHQQLPAFCHSAVERYTRHWPRSQRRGERKGN
jgi:hypothetical protein